MQESASDFDKRMHAALKMKDPACDQTRLFCLERLTFKTGTEDTKLSALGGWRSLEYGALQSFFEIDLLKRLLQDGCIFIIPV